LTDALYHPGHRLIDALAPRILSLKIVDVGASEYEGGRPPAYDPLSTCSIAEVVAFDPSLSMADRADNRKLLPFAVGDGKRHTLYECAAPMTSSLLLPNEGVISRFENLSNLCKVVDRTQIDTVRLDDVTDADRADYLKIDVQGATLLVLENATKVLESTLVVHTEVEFVEIYTGQPLFGDVANVLASRGFEFHHFCDFGAARELSADEGFAIGQSPSRHLWSDAVFVPNAERLDEMGERDLLLLAAIMHDCYSAVDFAHACLARSDRRFDTNNAAGYRKAVAIAETQSQ
jgi:FkbM family methyltransferase